MFTFSIKREIRHFHVVVVQKRERNVQKSVMHHAKLLFFLINPFVFMMFSLLSASLDRKVMCFHRPLFFFFQASAVGVFGAVPDPILGGGMSRIVGDSEQGNEFIIP